MRNPIIDPPLCVLSSKPARSPAWAVVCASVCVCGPKPVPLNLAARGSKSRVESPPSHLICVGGTRAVAARIGYLAATAALETGDDRRARQATVMITMLPANDRLWLGSGGAHFNRSSGTRPVSRIVRLYFVNLRTSVARSDNKYSSTAR